MYFITLLFASSIGLFCLVSSETHLIQQSIKTNLRGLKETPSTVQAVEVEKYLGRWYQVYGAPTNYIFQGYGKCITADYGLLDNGNISVLNAQLNLQDELEQISGYAYYKNDTEPGKLTVHLDGTPVDAPYWVVKLGEVKDEQYQYSIITTPSGISLWVLVRNIDDYFKNYDIEVKQFLDDYNFKYVSIHQDDTCIYVSN
jgi:lipocalin